MSTASTSTSAVRLLLSPALIGAASAVARRWGPEAGGWLAALPLTSGPVVLVLALEHGPAYAADACVGILLAIVALAAYALAYAWASRRVEWVACGASACAVYLVALVPLGQVRVTLAAAFVLACGAVVVVHRALPRERLGPPSRAPVWDIPVRMTLAAALVWTLGRLAGVAGPRVSGLLAPFPVAVTILSTFMHHHDGPAASRRFLRSLVGGLPSFAVFFLAAGALLPPLGTGPALTAATAASLATHAVAWRLIRRSRRAARHVVPLTTSE